MNSVLEKVLGRYAIQIHLLTYLLTANIVYLQHGGVYSRTENDFTVTPCILQTIGESRILMEGFTKGGSKNFPKLGRARVWEWKFPSEV